MGAENSAPILVLGAGARKMSELDDLVTKLLKDRLPADSLLVVADAVEDAGYPEPGLPRLMRVSGLVMLGESQDAFRGEIVGAWDLLRLEPILTAGRFSWSQLEVGVHGPLSKKHLKEIDRCMVCEWAGETMVQSWEIDRKMRRYIWGRTTGFGRTRRRNEPIWEIGLCKPEMVPVEIKLQFLSYEITEPFWKFFGLEPK